MDKYTFPDWEQAKERGNKLITKGEDKKISAAKKRYYWDEVDRFFKGKSFLFDGKNRKTLSMVKNFRKLLKNTDDKEELFKDEIKCVNHLFSKKYSALFRKIIRDKRDYDIIKVRAYYKENGDFEGYTKYVDPEFLINIHSEAYYKYREWLKKQFKQFKKEKKDSEIKKPEFTIRQIALKLVYEDKTVSENNCDEIIKQFGHNSGRKLYLRFNYYHKLVNRTGDPGTPTKMNNKINLIESVIKTLPENRRSKAKDELNILKARFDSEYNIF